MSSNNIHRKVMIFLEIFSARQSAITRLVSVTREIHFFGVYFSLEEKVSIKTRPVFFESGLKCRKKFRLNSGPVFFESGLKCRRKFRLNFGPGFLGVRFEVTKKVSVKLRKLYPVKWTLNF